MTGQRYEVEVDTALAALYEAHDRAAYQLGATVDSLHYRAGDKREYRGRIPLWGMTLADVLAYVPDREYTRADFARLLERYRGFVAECATVQAAIDEQAKLYTGWSRFFLVAQPNGHIHRSRECSTCYPSTVFGWLPALSGLTEADAVAAHGPRLCTVCFPSAPVKWTVGIVSDKAYCAGSGKVAGVSFPRRRYAKCETCGCNVAVTGTGLLRKHPPAKAQS